MPPKTGRAVKAAAAALAVTRTAKAPPAAKAAKAMVKETAKAAVAGSKRKREVVSPPAAATEKKRKVSGGGGGGGGAVSVGGASFASLEGFMFPTAVGLTEAAIMAQTTPFTRRTSDADFRADEMYSFVTWNVAGLRGLLKKNSEAIAELLTRERPDFLFLQETKLNPKDAEDNAALGRVDGYRFVDNVCATKAGYSGTRTYLRDEHGAACRTVRGFELQREEDPERSARLTAQGAEQTDAEGRVLTTLFDDARAAAAGPPLALVNAYVPNSGMTLDRLGYRVNAFDAGLRGYLDFLRGRGGATGVIWAGDLNVAERDYDRYFAGSMAAMEKVPGFSRPERASFRKTLAEVGLVDAFRHLYPNHAPSYTFWSARFNGRARGMGWRLDYFVLSAPLAERVVDCYPLHAVTGSDHCPVVLWLRR